MKKVSNLNEKRQKRAELVNEARTLLDTAEKENRDLTTEEDNQYERIMTDVDTMGNEIQTSERQQARRSKVEGLTRDLESSQGRFVGAQDLQNEGDGGGVGRTLKPRETEEYRNAFTGFIRRDLKGLSPDEYRALQADGDVSGGYVVTPQQFITQLVMALDDEVTIRPLATKFTVEKAESLGAPSIDHDPSDADWTSEIDTGDEDSTMDFGKRELKPHPVAKLIKVSNKLLRVSAIDVESLVRNRLGYKFGITQEKAFLTGDGAEKPLGVFIASANGINTGRDISTGNTATDIKGDGLIEAKFALKPQYWKRAKWIFHRDAIKRIRKLKDSSGDYLWQAGIATGQPDTIVDIPYLMSEYAPNTFSTGQYVGIIGDFSFYWIVDALDMIIQRLVELYARTNQVGFIGRMESDGMPVLEEAFARVKLG